MSILTDLVAGLAKPVTDLVSEFITDKDKAAELAARLSTMAAEHAHTEVMGQLAINAEEARSTSVFTSGWRPAAGWCCVMGMAINFLVIPIFGPMLDAYTKMNMQPLDLTVMMPVLIGMLGLTAARTVDKIKGVAS